MQPFLFFVDYSLRKKNTFLGSKFDYAARVGSDDLGYGPGLGFRFEPVQTSTC